MKKSLINSIIFGLIIIGTFACSEKIGKTPDVIIQTPAKTTVPIPDNKPSENLNTVPIPVETIIPTPKPIIKDSEFKLPLKVLFREKCTDPEPVTLYEISENGILSFNSELDTKNKIQRKISFNILQKINQLLSKIGKGNNYSIFDPNSKNCNNQFLFNLIDINSPKTISYSENNTDEKELKDIIEKFVVYYMPPIIRYPKMVLLIGDSHLMDSYGLELYTLIRETGVETELYAYGGSIPNDWMNGRNTGATFFRNIDKDFFVKTGKGSEPLLKDLIETKRPDIIIVSLGTNLFDFSPVDITGSVENLSKIVTNSGTVLFWVGPPNSSESMMSPEKINKFYKNLELGVSNYGFLIDSSKLTVYTGDDPSGIHYTGDSGTKEAKNWANKVFTIIQKN